MPTEWWRFAANTAALRLVAVVPRCVASRKMPFDSQARRAFWTDTYIDVGSGAGTFESVLSGTEFSPVVSADGKMSLADVFADFPVALLVANR